MASPLHSPRGVLNDLPDEFRCPISGDVLTDPVSCSRCNSLLSLVNVAL